MPGRGLLLWATTTPTQVELNISSFPFLTSLGGQLNIQHILRPVLYLVASALNRNQSAHFLESSGELTYLCGSTLITDKHVVCITFAS